MSHIVSIDKINQFLPREKLGLDTSTDSTTGQAADHDVISDLEETARDIVFSKLATEYDVSDWSNGPTSPPSLVRNILGLLVAGWVYDRQFSEETTEGQSYGQRRVREAYALLDELLDGVLVLDGVDRLDADAEPDASILETAPVFTMGEQF